LKHPWFKKWEGEITDVNEFQTEYLKRLKDYRAPTRLQHEVLSFLMKNLDTSERVKIKEVFRNITAQSSGDLTFKDLQQAFEKAEVEGATGHIEELKKCMDFDKDGKIKYTEFLVATINKNEALTDANVKFAFHHFDTDNNGYITVDNLVEAFNREGKGLSPDEIQEMLTQADISKTGQLSLEDFAKLMMYVPHKLSCEGKN
jgi:calcium-dependent protein kinase